MDLLKIFDSEPSKDTFLLVREGKHGIETFVSPKINSFPSAYKEQLKAFLNGVLKDLGGK